MSVPVLAAGNDDTVCVPALAAGNETMCVCLHWLLVMRHCVCAPAMAAGNETLCV